MVYSFSEFLPASYADTTSTRCIELAEGSVYTPKILGIQGVLVDQDPSMSSYAIEDEYITSETLPSGTLCSRMYNCVIAKEAGTAIIVEPSSYDSTLLARIQALVSSLRNGDTVASFQYISMLSSQTKNKKAENNQHREYKSKRSGLIAPCQL